MAWAGLNPAPQSPYNRSIGPHRRFTWVRADLGELKAIKNELGGTVNDVVLATVAGALGKHLRRRGQTTDGLELKAMIPVSVRADVERGALGNKVAAMMAPLPVWCQDPVARLDIVREELRGPQVERPGRGRAGAHGPDGLRPADGDGPGLAAGGPPAHVQPGGHQRARPAVPALPGRTAHDRSLPDGAAGQEPGPRHRAPVLRGQDQLRARRATTTCSGISTTSPTTCASRSTSSPLPPGSSSRAEAEAVEA